jgi:hypothetical protein
MPTAILSDGARCLQDLLRARRTPPKKRPRGAASRHIFFAASLSFLPLFFTSPLICSRRPSAARSGFRVAFPAASFKVPDARSLLSPTDPPPRLVFSGVSARLSGEGEGKRRQAQRSAATVTADR